MIRIVVAVENEFLRTALASTLQDVRDFEVVARVGSRMDVVAISRVFHPDVAVLRLSAVDQVRTTKQIRSACPEAKVLVLVAASDDTARLLEAGAAGCPSEDASLQELMAAIRAAAEQKG